MYAIIEESGGQRRVSKGEEILVDLIKGGEAAAGEAVTFDRVLVLGAPGESAKIGAPYISGASVSGEVVEPVMMGEKLYIQKIRPKKGYRRKTGHRQRYTKVRITAVG
jgi:large subunit ribosomal protein L21